jgi:hypothetical protein
LEQIRDQHRLPLQSHTERALSQFQPLKSEFKNGEFALQFELVLVAAAE